MLIKPGSEKDKRGPGSHANCHCAAFCSRTLRGPVQTSTSRKLWENKTATSYFNVQVSGSFTPTVTHLRYSVTLRLCTEQTPKCRIGPKAENARGCQISVHAPVALLGPGFHARRHHVSLSFLTVTSGPAPPAEPPPAAGAPAAPGAAPGAALDAAAAAAAVPSMVETSPCMKAHGGLFGELSNGQRSPLGQYTSPSPRRL